MSNAGNLRIKTQEGAKWSIRNVKRTRVPWKRGDKLLFSAGNSHQQQYNEKRDQMRLSNKFY